MSVTNSHYVVFGSIETNDGRIERFFNASEEFYEFVEKYNDNGYQVKITRTDSSIHMIADGMSSNYVVVGKILYKDFAGFPLEEMLKIKLPSKKGVSKIIREITNRNAIRFLSFVKQNKNGMDIP